MHASSVFAFLNIFLKEIYWTEIICSVYKDKLQNSSSN
jgi:hypothetical protein